MAILTTQINPRSEGFQANDKAMRDEVMKLRELTAAIAQGGGEKSRARHESRGKLVVRERIAPALDEGSPTFDFSSLAARDVYECHVPAGGVVTGIVRVSCGVCVIV